MSPRRRRPLRFVLVRANEGSIVDRRHAESEWPRQAVVEMARALARWVGEPVDETADRPNPENVTIRRSLSNLDLRELYRNAVAGGSRS